MTASCGCGAIISSLFLCTRNPSNDMLPMTILWIPLKHQRYESVSVKDLARAVGAGWTGPHHDYVLALLHLPGHKAAEIFFCCPGQGVVPQKNNTYDRAAARSCCLESKRTNACTSHGRLSKTLSSLLESSLFF